MIPDDLERPQRHRSVDRWWFEFCSEADDLSGWVELRWFPGRRIAHYSCAITGTQRDLVVVVDDAVPIAEPTRSLEFRHAGLWAQHVCESPWMHWTVGLECFGVAVDDPDEAMDGPAWGRPTPVGLDVEWEAPGLPERIGDSIEQRCRVSGEVLVGDEAFDIDATGWRGRSWEAPLQRMRAAEAVDIDHGRLALGGTEVILQASVSGTAPTPWAHRRSLVRVDGVLGWIEWADQLPSWP